MPQATRKDPAVQRAQDKESKRARGALSCAECRRLKLKCDKTVPCSSCKRRGCSAICPNGSLITGQGTRFVLADTEKLHEKIAQMSDRIRQLEDALMISHTSSGNGEPHPLLGRDLLKVKSSIELHAAIQGDDVGIKQEDQEETAYLDAFGTLAIRDDGAATFYGRSAGSESLLIGEVNNKSPEQNGSHGSPNPNISPIVGLHTISSSSQSWSQNGSHSNGLPPELLAVSQSFPLPIGQANIDLDYILENFLPPQDEAQRLCDLYLEQAPWFFGAVTKRQLHEEIIPLWYKEVPQPSTIGNGSPSQYDHPMSPPTAVPESGSTSSPVISSDDSTTFQKTGGPHDLALLFIIFTFGALTDMNLPAAPDNGLANHYHDLTKVALNLEGVLDRPPSVATVQVLALMGIYEGLRNGENSIESTWALMGMSTKLAQSLGLHRDCARWKLSPSEVQKRRALFWELFITDCWQSLATGRLATFSLPFVDCELPFDPDQTLSADGAVQPSFPYWKARFGAECVAPVVQGTLTSRAPKYSIILELDRKVRDMELPRYCQEPPPENAGLGETMSHYMPMNYKELTLLYIHRCFFTHAIQSNPTDPIKSQYAPSFLAGYRSACDLLGLVRKQFNAFPAQIARFWVLWTHAFSSSVMISSVVTHGSRSKVAPAALLELKSSCDLFEKAAAYGGRAVKFLPIIRRLLAKAQKVFFDTSSGVPPVVPNDIFKPSGTEEDDEMSIFGGKTHVVSTKVARPATARSPASSGSARSSQSPSGSPQTTYTTTNPLFAGVHPGLISEYNTFEGHISAQLQNAYNADSSSFNETLMSPRLHHAQSAQQQEQQRQQQQQQEAEQRRQREMEHQRRQQELLEEQRRQQEEEEKQRILAHEQYAEAQRQQQLQQQQMSHESHYGGSQEHLPSQGLPGTMPVQERTKHTLAHSRSRSNLHRMDYQEYHQDGRYQYAQQQASHSHMHSHPHSHPHTQPPPHRSHSQSSHSQPQHEMYAIPPEYMQHQPTPSSPEVISPISPTHSHSFNSPETLLDPHSHPHAQTYWTHHQSPTNGVMYQEQHHHSVPVSMQPRHPPQPQHYTPDAAMRGMAADDPRLQETWQSYMYRVGSSPLLDD